jgi:hypothetical protein
MLARASLLENARQPSLRLLIEALHLTLHRWGQRCVLRRQHSAKAQAVALAQRDPEELREFFQPAAAGRRLGFDRLEIAAKSLAIASHDFTAEIGLGREMMVNARGANADPAARSR